MTAALAPERVTYTVAEVAGLLGLSPSGLRNLIARGEFPVRPIPGTGRRIVLPRAEVDQLTAGTHPSQTTP